MSTALEAASLIMIPTSYSDGLLASVKPNDGAGDFTFSRGSNLSATRVNADGNIEKGYENLLLQSNSFSDAAWGGSSFNVIPNQEGYDGLTDAWLLETTTTGTSVRIQQSVSMSSIHTYSVYAKKGTSNWLVLRNNSNATAVWFDLENGVIGQENSASINPSIESIGDGWYRLSVLFDSSTSVRFYMTDGDDSYDATLGANVYIQDAMLNQGMVAYPYVETTTAPVAAGILEDTPRIDFSGGNQSLLLEPERRNLITYSEFTDVTGIWFTSSSTIEHNTEDTLSPEGYYNALKYNSPTSGGSLYYSGIPVSQNTKYTFTFYVKKGTNENTRLAVYDETNLSFIDVDIPYTASTEEWTRITHTFTTPVNCTSLRVYPQRFNAAFGTIYFYGFQVEDDGAGNGSSYPTSYIPTYGVSQTRLGELGREGDYIDTTITFGPTDDFSIFYDGEIFRTDRMIIGGGVSGLNAGRLWIRDTQIRLDGITPSVSLMADTIVAVDLNTRFKLLVKRNGATIDFFLDGSKLTTRQFDTDAPFVINSLFWSFSNFYVAVGRHNQLLVFDSALSDDECITLTTI